ncbi:CPBP family intramembrane metalloprotease [Actinoplanes sp. TBRC 11911]|uniref:CPBP family intramembrane glutamic endopeptidase n=1 Tax=Actinoplanes sp. TBRC 11911 TaxID=2729386 RepID=UPI00145F61F5|nr:CPBP family intramembrane glutamic endopeptidase [Actinoplanes sp. TBRC 11911]NMO55783.1 CPBP family intramembrane metalloprotease [Actinoplanes sp. TBRC 11911]
MLTFVRRWPLPTFFVLTFVIGWLPWPFYAAGILPGTNFLPIAPLASALIVLPISVGRAGLRDLGARMIRWRVPWYCYLAAVGLPLAVIFGTAWANAGLGGTSWSLSTMAWGSVAVAFAVRWINPLDGPLGEEPGWRGYAYPRFMIAPLPAALVLGVIVAVWHLPLVFSGEGNPVGWVGLPTTFVITIVYCWLFRRSRGSVLLTMLFHVTQGAVTPATFGYSDISDSSDVDRMLWLGFGAWIVVALAVVLLDRAVWRTEDVVPDSSPVLTTAVVQKSLT